MSDYFNNFEEDNRESTSSDNTNGNSYNSNEPNTNNYIILPGGMFLATRICGMFSFALGMLSVTACCLGYLSIPLGALGILFGMLCRRRGEPLPPICKTGLMLSIAGLIIGICVFTLHLYTTITDPAFWEYTQDIWEMYGITMTDMNS